MNEELALLTALVRQRAQEQNELDHQLVETIEGIRARLAALEIQARLKGDSRRSLAPLPLL